MDNKSSTRLKIEASALHELADGDIDIKDSVGHVAADLLDQAAQIIETYEKHLSMIANEEEAIRVYVEGKREPKEAVMKRCARAALEKTGNWDED